MPLSEFEISKIAEIVAGKVGTQLNAKDLRRVIDTVVDKSTAADQQTTDRVTGVTCDTAQTQTETASTASRPAASQPVASQAYAAGSSMNPSPKQGGLYEKLDSTDGTRVILAAFGHNRPGVISTLTQVLAECQCSLEDISQKIMREFFTLIMIVDISTSSIEFSELVERVKATEAQLGMKVYLMHEDTFQYMHRI